MQVTHVAGIKIEESVPGITMQLDHCLGPSIETEVECERDYFDITIMNRGLNPRYPKPFVQRVIVLRATRLVGMIDARQRNDGSLTTVILGQGESLKGLSLVEETQQFPGELTATPSMVLNIVVESADDRPGNICLQTIPLGLAKAVAGWRH